MRRPPILVLLLLLAVPAGSACAQGLTEIARQAKHSVVLLKVLNNFGAEQGTGTGFFVNTGMIVTNYHVIEGGDRVQAVLSDGTTLEVTGVLAEDENSDLAVLQVDHVDSRLAPALLLGDSDSVESGLKIVVLGNPLGFELTLSNGIVSAVRNDEELPNGHRTSVIQFTAAISAGSSGSPLMNLKGEVIGVVVSQYLAGQNLNFAIPSSNVRRLLGTIDAGAVPRSLGGGLVQGSFLRNVVISLIVFTVAYFGFRRLK